jgi:hypothetical protein
MRRSKSVIPLILMALFLISTSLSRTQDASETPTPRNPELATDIAPIPPSSLTQEITPVPTQEIPVPTQDITPVPTREITAPTPDLTAVPVLAGEPPLMLLFAENFEADIHPVWQYGAGLAYADGTPEGKAIQIYNTSEPMLISAPLVRDAVIQARFMLDYGTARLHLRQSETDSYTVLLDNLGHISLFRSGVLLSETTILPGLPQARLAVDRAISAFRGNGISIALRSASPLITYRAQA